MNQALAAWGALDGRRRFVVAISIAAAVLCMGLIWRLSTQQDMALLYAGLEPATAGEVIAALEARAVPFEVRGGAIYVASDQRDGTRLALAAEGLPATGGVGYELLDTMTGFGTTSQMFDAAYWRAKEGELARTVLASRNIRSARVHIATPPRQAFSRNTALSASVTVTPARGRVATDQAQAIRYMVASAVSGLAPEDVTVIDSVNGVLLEGGATEPGTDAATLDDRAAQMKANLERLLAARVGAGKALVELHIDADMDSQRITERVIDPASRVAISTDLEETTEQSSGSGGGNVTVASNLPAGDAEATGESSNSNRSETRERQNYEVSETRRERVIQPGQIRRITVAVMLDGITETAADGTRTWQPRSEEEMEQLRALVESAIGFDPARGDRVTLQSLEFPAADTAGTEAVAGGFALPGGNIVSLIQTVFLGLVALALGFFVVRPLLSRPPLLPEPEILAGSADLTAAPSEVTLDTETAALEQVDQNKLRNLRELVVDRREDSADVLRRWIESPEQAEGVG
ncbi:MAG: flagellar basal-body MS-ring/collar protein FliF [Pseudomonadota bacterium]